MSKNIIIQEGGQAKTLANVTALRTALSGGGSCDWVPRQEANAYAATGILVARTSGVYTPPAGIVGFRHVTVDVPNDAGYLVGTAPDGNTYKYTVDENGNAVQTVIPSAIRIATRPTRRNYTRGEAIDFTGLVVQLYDGNGNLLTDARYPDGIVPMNELSFPVTTAQLPAGGTAVWPEGVPVPVPYSATKLTYAQAVAIGLQYSTNSYNKPSYMYVNSDGVYCCCCQSAPNSVQYAYRLGSDHPFTFYYAYYDYSGNAVVSSGIYVGTKGSSGYYNMEIGGRYFSDNGVPVLSGSAAMDAALAAVIQNPSARDTLVSVNWTNTYNQKQQLSAAFPITVTAAQ